MEPIAPGSSRPPTINDVAAIAGVAASTVSRALSRPDRVHPATRDRIVRIADDLQYMPSSHARALRSGRTDSIGLLVADITNPFYFGIIRGTQIRSKAAGFAQILVDTEESETLEAASIKRLRPSVDGIVLASSRLDDKALAEASAEIPLVAINRSIDGVSSIVIDTADGMVQAIEHLVSLGHRRIAYIMGPEGSWSNRLRWAAISTAAQRLGVTAERVGPFAPLQTSGGAAADAILNVEATACIAFNDLIAIGVLHRLAERGLRVPADVSVVGCDDIFGADFCNPPLTTLTAASERVGQAAVALLIERIANPSLAPARTRLGTHLTIRDSTGRAPESARRA